MADGGSEREALVVSNKQVIFKDYITGFPKESDMAITTTSSNVKLKVAAGSKDIVVKNLYLSCDPYMPLLLKSSSGVLSPYTLGSAITGWGVAKVMDSGDPELKQGDLVYVIIGWEEYSLLKSIDGLFKINFGTCKK